MTTYLVTVIRRGRYSQQLNCKDDEMGGSCNTHTYNIMIAKPQAKRPSEKKHTVEEIEVGGLDWINAGPDRDKW